MTNKRKYCLVCERPEKSCYCHITDSLINTPQVFIWQHPLEFNHPKGTAKLLSLCLCRCIIKIGEIFLPDELGVNLDQCALLYPGESSHQLANKNIRQLIAIDGTWRKSRKIIHLNPWLKSLPRISLSNITSNYSIRKPHQKNQLSTFESICYALHHLDQSFNLKKSELIFDKYVNHLTIRSQNI